LQLIKINVYICEVEIKTKKMAHEKTEKNPKKAGRPRLEPTVTVSVRIPKKMKEEISARFGNALAAKVIQHRGALIPTEAMHDLINSSPH
jgi:hypothetical protein